jgi:hypothetical protein
VLPIIRKLRQPVMSKTYDCCFQIFQGLPNPSDCFEVLGALGKFDRARFQEAGQSPERRRAARYLLMNSRCQHYCRWQGRRVTLHRTKGTLNLLLVNLPGFELKKLTSSPSDRRRLQTVDRRLHLGVN